MPHSEDMRLLLQAQARGVISEADVRECLEQLAAAEQAGRPERLAQLILRRRLMTSNQFVALLRETRDLATSTQDVIGSETWGALAAATVTLEVDAGGRIGGYLLKREVARGGMGILFEGWSHDGRRVAVKVLSAEAASSGAVVARFREEARLASTLDHPNLIKVHEVGQERGIHYLVMEFFQGKSLAELIRPGRIAPKKVIEVLAVIARACSAMHARKVIHRDIKPGNIMVGTQNRVCLTDFGLAKDAARTDSTLTQIGFGKLIGTPAYMAPEQARGEISAIGPWTDVYGLGAVVYRALTGRYPVARSSFMKTLQGIALGEVPSLRSLRPDAPVELEQLLAAAMALQPVDRPSALQLAEAFEDLLARQLIRMPPGPASDQV